MSGTSSSSQTQSSQLAPYAGAASGLNGILGNVSAMAANSGMTPNAVQTGAINTAVNNGNTFNAPMVNGTLGLLNGGGANNNNGAISNNLGVLNNGIVGTTASGANIGANSGLQPLLDQIGTNATEGVDSSWAAAGRGGSPGEATAIGRGVAQGEAPVIASQYNTDTTNALNSANNLYGAGNTTYGMLNNNNATANSNIGAGETSASNTMGNSSNILSAEGNQFGIPASQYQTLLGMISPVAAQFGQSTGQSNGTQTMSPVQQAAMLMQGFGSMVPKGNITFGS